MSLIRLTAENRALYEPQIMALEHDAVYPLGLDFFKIDHGTDYLRFFKRLGEADYYVWIEKDQVVAVACAILRRVPLTTKKIVRTWYLCDLKVRPDFRKQGIPLKMLRRGFLSSYLRCQRGYAISMNAQGQKENRVARILSRFRYAPLSVAARLELWSLEAATMRSVQTLVEKHRGPVSYLSLRGIKDIVLQSNGKPIPLQHVQFGPNRSLDATANIIDGATYMLSAPANDPLAQALRAEGLEPSSEATIIQHRMQTCDWRWVLTSEI